MSAFTGRSSHRSMAIAPARIRRGYRSGTWAWFPSRRPSARRAAGPPGGALPGHRCQRAALAANAATIYCGVPVQGGPGAVVADRGPRVGVGGGVVHIAQRHACIQRGGDERAAGCGADRFGDPGAAGCPADDPGGTVLVEPAAATYLRRALAEQERGEILADLGRSEVATMQVVAAEKHLRAALASGATLATRADAASWLGRCAIVSGGRSAGSAAGALSSLAGELWPA